MNNQTNDDEMINKAAGCMPNLTTHTTWAPAAELCFLWPPVDLIVWVYSANTARQYYEHSSSTAG